jgi:hypothetical protein
MLGNFLKKALPIAAGIFGSPALGAAVSGAMGMIGSNRTAKGMQNAAAGAGQTALGGFNYLQGSPIGQQYLPAGGAAIGMQQNLLGLGDDPAAAEEAFRRYQESTGFQGQLRAGQQAIGSSAAARGLIGSGSTAKALQAHGQQLGAQSFNNYLGQLGGVAGMGLQAGGMVGQAATQGYGQAAGMQYGAGMGAAQERGRGWDQMMGGLGGAWDAWNAGRGATPAPDGGETFMPSQWGTNFLSKWGGAN